MSYKSVRKILSENLQKQMDTKNVTQQELSEALGVSQSTVSNWLREEKYPRVKRIQQMADFFNINRSDLTEDKTKQVQITKAAHLEGEDLTEDEWKNVENYIQFLKSNRNK